MKTVAIKANHTVKGSGEKREAEGTVELYDIEDVDDKTIAYVVERANQMIVIRAQDDLRQTLIDEDPNKGQMKKLRNLQKDNPEAFQALLEKAGLSTI